MRTHRRNYRVRRSQVWGRGTASPPAGEGKGDHPPGPFIPHSVEVVQIVSRRNRVRRMEEIQLDLSTIHLCSPPISPPMIFIMSAPFSHTPSHLPLTPLSLLDQTPVPVVAIVGYTNAGKSTLLNTLTQAGVLAEDKLFATLDPTTRKIRLR